MEFLISMRNRKYILMILIPLFFGFRMLYGLPEGSTAVTGGGTFSTQGNSMIFTAPDGSIFNHTSFNVASGESVQFVQPHSNARVLNRITTTSSVSTIDGRVEANGRLYFAAPGGLIFGEGAVIQARHLQAIAGDIFDSDFQNGVDKYPSLSGTIENKGSISADSIILGGKTVKNSGNLTALGGSIHIAAGGGMEIISSNGALAVEVNDGIQGTNSMVGDLAGHALLQSGILQASSVEVAAETVEQSSSIHADKIKFTGFTELAGENGSVHGTNVILEAKEDRFVSARINGENNQISGISLTGSFSDLSVRSANSFSVSSSFSDVSSVDLQNGDFRTDRGDISLNVSFSPISTFSESTLMVAAKNGSVDMSNDPFIFGFDQVVVYGNNISYEVSEELGVIPENWFLLNATTLDFDSLSVGLNAHNIIKLEGENPQFDLTGNSALSTNVSSVQNGSSLPPANPGSASSSGSGGLSTGSSIAAPVETPSLTSLVGTQSGTDQLTEQQLAVAMDLGLYSNYSYLLQSITEYDATLNRIAEAGGISVLLGKSFDTVERVESDAIEDFNLPTVEGSDFDDSFVLNDFDDVEEDTGESMEQNQDGDVDESKPQEITRTAIGIPPAFPISQPISSSRVIKVLEQALSPDIEDTLKGFSNR